MHLNISKTQILVISQTRYVQEEENRKGVMKEIKEEIIKWKDIFCL